MLKFELTHKCTLIRQQCCVVLPAVCCSPQKTISLKANISLCFELGAL